MISVRGDGLILQTEIFIGELFLFIKTLERIHCWSKILQDLSLSPQVEEGIQLIELIMILRKYDRS